MGNGQAFSGGRYLSAWLGLVPRQYSTAGRPVLLGISKRGDRYLRALMVEGARSAIVAAARRILIATRVGGDWWQGGADQLPAGEGYAVVALAEPRGMRPLVAHCHFGLSKLYRRTGQREQDHEYLSSATTMYREMDMRFYLAQAETSALA